MRQIRLTAAIAAAAVAVGCILLPVDDESGRQATDEFEFCWVVLDAFLLFRENLPRDPYVYTDPADLYASVNEPFTAYTTPEQTAVFMSHLTTSSVGMGIVLDSVAPGFLITTVFPTSPAETAGLLKGDTIVASNGESLAGVPYDSLTRYLRGNEGDVKSLEIHRVDTVLTVTVTLGPYLAPSVIADSLDSATAYIGLSLFSDSTAMAGGSAAEFREALKQTAWARYTILDLRDNGGGLLDQCIEITSEFIPRDSALVRVTERYYDERMNDVYTRETSWDALDRGGAIDRMFYVLVNEGTASASEILVASVRAYRAADISIVGSTTYGKARAQRYWGTPEGGLARVTYARMTPVRGAPYDIVGIVPDVQTDSSALEIALGEIADEIGLGKRQAAALRARGGAVAFAREEAGFGRRWMPLCLTQGETVDSP